jgi:predicted P-loop ATPase
MSTTTLFPDGVAVADTAATVEWFRRELAVSEPSEPWAGCRKAIAALERSLALPAATRPEPINWREFQQFLHAIGRDRGPLVVSLFPRDPSKPCIHVPCDAAAIPRQWIEERQQLQPELALGLVLNHPLDKPADWGSQPQHLNRAGKVRAWGASNDHISHGIGIWAECDGGLPLEAQQALPGLAGLLEPSLAVWSGSKSLHLYWLLEPGEVLEPGTFKAMQQRLAARLTEVAPEAKPDTSISNAARLMRAPGGLHPKTGRRCHIHTNKAQRFTVATLLEMLPEPEPAPAPAPAAQAPGLDDAVPLAELLPRDLERLAAQGAPEGSRNADAFRLAAGALAVADAAAAAGLRVDGTPEAVLLAFAARCSPPLAEREALTCLRSAESQPRSTDPGWPERLRWHLNQRHHQQRHQQAPAARPQHPATAPAPGEPTGMAWLLQRLDNGMGPAGARKTTAGDLAQTLLLVAGDRLQFNQQTLVAEIDGEPIEGPALDTLHVELQLGGMNIAAEATVDAVATAALRRPFHPVREYLDRVGADEAIEPLDLTDLVGRFLRSGDPAGTLHGRMLAKTLIGAVARAYQPGCKVDTCCVLVGQQGAQKSTFWEALAGAAFYSCSGLGNLDKDALLLVHATWFLEAAELEQITSKRAAGELKNFLSTAVDCFRVPYGRRVERRPRPSILVGTSNRSDFLADETGSRRFWIIPVTAPEIDVEGVRAILDRIWKSAVLAYRAGDRWWLDKADAAASEMENQAFTASHPWEAPVAAWLEAQGTTPFSTIDCLTRAGLRDKAMVSRRDEMALATVLAGLGWKQQRVLCGGKRVRLWAPTQPAQPAQPQNREVGQRKTSGGNGSQPPARPTQPKNNPLPETVPVGGSGTERSKGTKKGWAGRSSAENLTAAVDLPGPTSPAKVGQRLGQSAEVGLAPRTPSTVIEWVEAGLAALRLAPHFANTPEVSAWLKRQPGAPAISQTQLAGAMERLRQADQECDQLGLEVAP